MKRKHWLLLISCTILIALSIPELTHKNKGKSKSSGTVGKGKLENPYLLPWSGQNFRYFSPISYFLFDNGYTHSKVHNTILEAYKICETTCPKTQFRIMECSDKSGGKLLIHKTHQNGLSVDFMSPKIKTSTSSTSQKQSHFFDRLGLWHYLLEFSNSGQVNISKKTNIDFETMARHILALDKSARNNGLRIKKVIFKIELKDDFFKTPSGKKVKQKGIYFAQALPNWTNKVHDDHYHIDFEILR